MKSLKERLLKYLSARPNQWIAKGTLCDLARAAVNATGEHTGRRLRELAEDGLLEVKYEKGHAHYRAVPKAPSLEVWFEQLHTDH